MSSVYDMGIIEKKFFLGISNIISIMGYGRT